MNDTECKNIAETLAEVLPEAMVLYPIDPQPGDILQVALPNNAIIKEIDTEKLLLHPRRTKALAAFSEAESFVAYVRRYAQAQTMVWGLFNPQAATLEFVAVIDEHAHGHAGWREHRAIYRPELSAEWKAWAKNSGTTMSQIVFAEWIQDHEDDINSTTNGAASGGMPTSLQMHTMATEFVANEERVLKSSVRLQSGGVRLTYIADPDAGTTESMQMFDKFAIGIPVFHGGSAWSITARLKYRLKAGAVSFFYELIRPDRVYEGAGRELIQQIKMGLGEIPLLMGHNT